MGKIWGNAVGGYKTQKRNGKGQFSSGKLVGASLHSKAKARKGGFVPYARKGVGHTTVGLNTGISITKNRRISGGFYLKTESGNGQKKAKQIRKAEANAQAAIASRISGTGRATPYTEGIVRSIQAKTVRRFLGGERKIGAAGYGRVGTDRNGLPTGVIQFNSSRDKKQGSRKARDRGTIRYNKLVTKTRGHKVKGSVVNSRPQRRRANGQR